MLGIFLRVRVAFEFMSGLGLGLGFGFWVCGWVEFWVGLEVVHLSVGLGVGI